MNHEPTCRRLAVNSAAPTSNLLIARHNESTTKFVANSFSNRILSILSIRCCSPTGLSFSFIARMLEKSWRYDLVLELGVFLEDAVCPINTIKVSGTGPTWSRACENVPHQVAAFWASARLPKGGCPSRGISPTRSSLSLDIDGTFPFNVWTESGQITQTNE